MLIDNEFKDLVMTDVEIIEELSLRRGITKGQAKYLLKAYVNTLKRINNETDAVSMNLLGLGKMYLKTKNLESEINRLEKSKEKAKEGSKSGFQKRIDNFKQKLCNIKESCSKGVKLANFKRSVLSIIMSVSGMSKGEISYEQNKWVSEKKK